MLVQLSVVEQKYQAVLAAIGDGREVTDVARQFGASRQTLHAWLVRYEAEGLAGAGAQVAAAGVMPPSDGPGG